jgi:pimeloyl-ACP methyl ester carboxylesterase
MPNTTIEGLTINFDHYVPDVAAAQRVIYIHGTGCNAKVFAEHLSVISKHHELVAIDLPGHGGSGGDGFRSATDHAFFVGALIEHLGWGSCVVAGHSLGGGIALAVAVYFEPLVAGLMLIDTGARLRVNPKVLEFARKAVADGRNVAGDSRLGYADTTHQQVVDAVNTLTAGCDPKVIYKDWIAGDSFDFMSRLAQVTVPTLAICGEHDMLTPPKYHTYLGDNMPDCRVVTIEDAGHWPFVENPAAFNSAVLEFLARL